MSTMQGMTEVKVKHPEIVSIKVGDYTVQRYTEWPDGEGKTGWLTCWKPGPEVAPGVPTSVPAIFSDVTHAEEELNRFRDRNPDINYRLIRTVEIVEVVHA